MYTLKMRPYEGEQPYIFVSYAHSNKNLVYPIIDLLAQEGYRIWFDEGIVAGSEWPEYIAEHLQKATAVIAFITPEFVASNNCRREIHYTLDKGTYFIYTMLRPTQLSEGLQLQLAGQNGIMRYEDTSFLQKIGTVSLLDGCRENGTQASDDSIIRSAKVPRKASKVNAWAVCAVLSAVTLICLMALLLQLKAAKRATSADEAMMTASDGEAKMVSQAETAPPTVTDAAPQAETSQSTAASTLSGLPLRDLSQFAYAYSDDAGDSACYTAEEFAQIVKLDNVREYLPLGTKIKMLPNSPELTDKAIEFELVAYRHYRLADGSEMAKTTWLMVSLLNQSRKMFSEEPTGREWAWKQSDMRNWLNDSVYPTLPAYWQNMIQCVQVKSARGNKTEDIELSEDYLFLPAASEVNKYTLTELVNAKYAQMYPDEIDSAAEEKLFSRFEEKPESIKTQDGKNTAWWTRSNNHLGREFWVINTNGSLNGFPSFQDQYKFGICIGFCL